MNPVELLHKTSTNSSNQGPNTSYSLVSGRQFCARWSLAGPSKPKWKRAKANEFQLLIINTGLICLVLPIFYLGGIFCLLESCCFFRDSELLPLSDNEMIVGAAGWPGRPWLHFSGGLGTMEARRHHFHFSRSGTTIPNRAKRKENNLQRHQQQQQQQQQQQHCTHPRFNRTRLLFLERGR